MCIRDSFCIMEVKFDNYNYYMVYITRILYIVLQSGLHCERMKEIL